MPIKVLLIEDSPGDVRLTKEALRGTNNSIRLLGASDGVQTMALPRNEKSRPLVPRPAGQPLSCWISISPRWMAARSWPKSRQTPV